MRVDTSHCGPHFVSVVQKYVNHAFAVEHLLRQKEGFFLLVLVIIIRVVVH